MKLTEHFNLEEFRVSRDYPELARVVYFTPEEKERVRCFCAYILEPLRARLGNIPIRITSGKRSWELNRAVDGHPNSHHMMREDHIAIDLVAEGVSPDKVIELSAGLPFRYIIQYDDFVHISGPDSSGIYGQYIDKRS